MKILFLTNVPSPYRVEFFNELGKYCDLTVTFEGKRAIDRNDKWKSKKNNTFQAIFLKGIRTKSDQFFCPQIISVIKKRYDQIIVSNYSSFTSILAIEYMHFHKIKFWIEADGGLIPRHEHALKKAFKGHLISSATHWFSSGKMTSKYFMHYGANENQIYTYPFSSLKEQDILEKVPNEKEKKVIRNDIGIKEEDKIILSVGQIIERKGFDILLEAWKEYNFSDKKWTLYIVGGSATSEYLHYIEKNHIKNVHFVEFKTKDELKKFYLASDLFVLPTREDIWGLVINEAMASGLPVITTDHCVAGLELVKNNENGFIVSVNNKKVLANKIDLILSEDDLRKRLSENSLRMIKNYTIEKMVIAHVKILSEVV